MINKKKMTLNGCYLGQEGEIQADLGNLICAELPVLQSLIIQPSV